MTAEQLMWAQMPSPLGRLLLVAGDDGLRQILLPDRNNDPAIPAPGWRRDDDALAMARVQLEEYFAGTRRVFDLPLAPRGTRFQLAVLAVLAEIPFGTTCSYGEMARRLGQPTASRAVGAANGRNPLAIVLPCHRVVGSDGSLTGYAGGLGAKRWLLRHEGVALADQQRSLFG
ncbi:MAG: methylated-DNA--[protein]-cysteine S-methyltransferase [Gammaproteobacteria bacterium]|nr:MAG: methylated-DNA--[protein]-cysteine S-methyltransferase [Gammaproteobacteria bacterium]